MRAGNKYDLTQGSILGKLFTVALPIIGMQVIQMTYNLTDMFWLGRLSSDAVAASGVVGLLLWLSMAFFLIGRMGAEIGVSQNLGAGDAARARKFAENAVTLSVCIGAGLSLIYIFGREYLIGFFGIQESHVREDAIAYLAIVSIGFPLTFINAAISGIFTGAGNSRMSLVFNGTGLAVNMILDPILILVLGFGVRGAAIATVSAQVVVTVLAIAALTRHKSRPFEEFTFLKRPVSAIVKQIFKWVTPMSLESFLFTFLTMIVTTFVAHYGSGAISASRVSTQIESLTWLVGGGFASALTAFAGQNFGAGKWDRIHQSFKIATAIMIGYGAFVGALLYFGAHPIMLIFIPDNPGVVAIGMDNMRILAYIQIAVCLEGVAAGLFRGRGKTVPPSIVSVTFNSLRVVMAYVFTFHTPLALRGIWIALALGAGLRGICLYIWYTIDQRKTLREAAGMSD